MAKRKYKKGDLVIINRRPSEGDYPDSILGKIYTVTIDTDEKGFCYIIDEIGDEQGLHYSDVKAIPKTKATDILFKDISTLD